MKIKIEWVYFMWDADRAWEGEGKEENTTPLVLLSKHGDLQNNSAKGFRLDFTGCPLQQKTAIQNIKDNNYE